MNRTELIQSTVDINTINLILSPINLKIRSLIELNDGIILPKLVEILINKKITKFKPNPSFFQKKQNIQFALEELSAIDKTFNKDQFNLNDEKNLIFLASTLLIKFYVVIPKRDLIIHISNLLKDFDISIKNMTKSFANGLPFIALLSKISEGSIKYEDKGDNNSNFNYIKSSCETLNIPFILTNDCLSSNPDENCNIIQSFIILKSIKDFDFSNPKIENKPPEKIDVQTSKIQNDTTSNINKNLINIQSKISTKITQYNDLINKLNEIIEKEKDKIKDVNKDFSMYCFNNKSIIITEFNKTILSQCNSIYYQAKGIMENINQIASKNNIELPSDLINIIKMKHKIDELNNIYQKMKQNLENDFEQSNQLTNMILKADSLESMQSVFDFLKTSYDMDNWENFPNISMIYTAGMKLKKFNDEKQEKLIKAIKLATDNFKNSIIQFQKKFCSYLTEMKNSNNKITYISFNSYLNDISKYFNELNNIDVENKLKLPDFTSQINLLIKLHDDFNNDKLLTEIENNNYLHLFDLSASELKKFDAYKNLYSESTFSEAQNKRKEISASYHAKLLINDIQSLKECQSSIEEANSIMNDAKTQYPEYDFAWPDIKEIEELINKFKGRKPCSINIEDLQLKIKNDDENWDKVIDFFLNRKNEINQIQEYLTKAQNFLKETKSLFNLETDFYKLYPQFFSFQNDIQNVIDAKKWDELATGSIINTYKKDTPILLEQLEIYKKKIIQLFDKQCCSIEKFINEMKFIETDNPEIDIENYECKSISISRDITDTIPILLEVNERLNQNSKDKLKLMKHQLATLKDDCLKHIQSVPSRVLKKAESYHDRLNQVINDQQQMRDEINNISDQIAPEKLQFKGNNLIEIYDEIRYIHYWMTVYVPMYSCNVEIPDITSTYSLLYNLIILYESTLILKPKTFSNDLLQRLQSCLNNFDVSLACAIIYVNDFTKLKDSFNIEEDIDDAKNSINSIVNAYEETFLLNISKSIQIKLTTGNIFNGLLKHELFAEASQYIPNFKYDFINSINPRLNSRYHLYNMKNILSDNRLHSNFNKYKEFATCYEQVLIERSKYYIHGDSIIFIDFGNYNVRYSFVDYNIDIIPETIYVKDVSFIENLNRCISSKFGMTTVQKNLLTITDVLKSVRKKIEKLNVYNDITVIITAHSLSMNYEYYINEVLKSFTFVKEIAAVDSSVGIVGNRQNKTAGIAVDMGDSCLSITPVFNEEVVQKAKIINEKCGNYVALKFQTYLYSFSDIKKRIRTIDDFRHEISFINVHQCNNGDENDGFIKIQETYTHYSKKAINVAENTFFGSIDNLTNMIIEAAENAAKETNNDINIFLSNVVLAGGVSATNGLASRLSIELKEKYIHSEVFCNDPQNEPLRGVKYMTSLPNFYTKLLKKK